jgi:predicted O-methyltransferase YrrM
METAHWNPASLLALSGSYWQTFTLHAGIKLNLFSQFGGGRLSAGEVAQQLGTDRRGTTMLLNALTAMGLLEKSSHRYSATDAASKFLDKSSPAYIGHMIMHHHFLADTWARMDEAVTTGRPLRSRAANGSASKREAFLMGMYTLASQQAPEIAGKIDLRGRKRLLDLGGGPGTYAIHFCRQNEALEADIVDLPTTREFAERAIRKYGLEERIRFIEGDYVESAIKGRYDVAWLSHILHAEGPDVCQRIAHKVEAVLEPGGIVAVHDFILDDSMDGPLFPALFALNMLQGTQQGQTYSEPQIRSMLEAAGIRRIERLAYRGPTESSILLGIKD